MASYLVQVKTVSEANSREHWANRAKRKRLQGAAVTHVLDVLAGARRDAHLQALAEGEAIHLVRIAPRSLDGDNLQASLKTIRDAVACWLLGGRIGQHDEKCTWHYAQRSDGRGLYAVEVWLPGGDDGTP